MKAEPAGKPAILGGRPVFDEPVVLTRPTMDINDELLGELADVLRSGMLTNGNRVVAFERAVADFLGVDHVVATSSCTTGLLMVFRCLGVTGDVVLPSFTFMASGHAVVWNGLTPVFADSDRHTYNLSAAAAADLVGHGTRALLATHVFGSPAAADELQGVADRHGIPLVMDAAHAFGATYPDGSKVGSKGFAEVFSLSPTKLLSTGEGGLVATADGHFAKELRCAREYGNSGAYDSLLFGLNGRMAELAAVIGIRGLAQFPTWLGRRRYLVERYLSRLDGLPGVAIQEVLPNALSSNKDFSVRIRGKVLGLDRNTLAKVLAAENIPTRNYFDPPLHRQTAYQPYAAGVELPNTDSLSVECLTLPLYSHMPEKHIDSVCAAVIRAYDNREQIMSSVVDDTIHWYD